MTVPRRLPRTQGQRIRNVDLTAGRLSGQGMTASARPVPSQSGGARLYQPEPWTQSYSYPGDLTVTAGTARIYNDTARIMAIRQVAAAVGTAPVGAAVVLDLRINGISVFADSSTRPTIADGANVGTGAIPPQTLFMPGDYLTVDIAQVGSSTAGADLTVQIRAV